ncbi:hypothetical protein ACFQ0B_04935 [Nonomuraea thailandensis]
MPARNQCRSSSRCTSPESSFSSPGRAGRRCPPCPTRHSQASGPSSRAASGSTAAAVPAAETSQSCSAAMNNEKFTQAAPSRQSRAMPRR